MMTACSELVAYCNNLLESAAFQDYCPNGLQVEGRREVSRVVSGVTASQALIDAAAEAGADLLLVHHGYFWRGEAAPITGLKQRRIRALLEHGINLVAYHLPLDVHAKFGNNVQLDRKSTRLNSSHVRISYAVFCLKKKTKKSNNDTTL